MSWKCPSCGFESDLAPLAFKQSGPLCPLCGKVPQRVVSEDTLDKGLRWIEQENPALFDHLIEKMDRKAARSRTVRRVALAAGVVFVALLVYLIFS